MRWLWLCRALQLGFGVGDVTGPAANVVMLGYMTMSQTSSGLHLRTLSRAMVVVDDAGRRLAFVNVESNSMSRHVKRRVLARLEQELPGKYTEATLCLTGQHTHSGPGGFHGTLLLQLGTYGFVEESAAPLVDGIVASILEAERRLAPGDLRVAKGDLAGASINRSPTAYLLNPEAERAQYGKDTDTEMLVLSGVDASGKKLGAVTWFATHATSMNNTNQLISSDNKGVASLLLEEAQQGPSRTLGRRRSYVALFPQPNHGDTSPNTKGPKCIDTGLPCDAVHSACNGRCEKCIAAGPGRDMFESTQIIGKMQSDKAAELLATTESLAAQEVGSVSSFVDFPNVQLPNASRKLCGPALGYATMAGTIDGHGDFDFVQGTTKDGKRNPLWDLIIKGLIPPSKEDIACQGAKRIAVDMKSMPNIGPWADTVLELQVHRVGRLFVLAVPVEVTTMAGRRMRAAVTATLEQAGLKDPIVVVNSLSNQYTHYVTTYEEYQQQRYEAGSTLYGPHTLEAYIQELSKLAHALVGGPAVPPGTPDETETLKSLLPGVILDSTPPFKHFGDVSAQPAKAYAPGQTAEVSFHSACPRSHKGNFVSIEQLVNGQWTEVADDSVWETRMLWKRWTTVDPFSYTTVQWQIPPEAKGTFRIVHNGTALVAGFPHRKLQPFTGTSAAFTVGNEWPSLRATDGEAALGGVAILATALVLVARYVR